MKDFSSGDGNLSSSGAAELHGLQTIGDQPVGLGFPHRPGRYRPGGALFSPPARRSCRCIEGILVREWGAYLPRVTLALRSPANQRSVSGNEVSTPCGLVSTRATPFPLFVGVVEVRNYLRSRDGALSAPVSTWRHDHQPISDRPVKLKFPHGAGRYRPGGPPCVPASSELSRYGRIYDSRIGAYPSRVALTPNPSESVISQWSWGYPTVRGGIDLGDHLYVPGLLEL